MTNDTLGTAPDSSKINGNEYQIPDNDDLQYACIFDLQAAKDCSMMSGTACDCQDAGNPDQNPLCNDQQQVSAKAYPGTRHLQVLRAVGTQGIVGSICPAQSTDPGLINFGYRPAVKAIVDRLKQALGGQCLPRSLTPDLDGQVQCLILEARVVPDGQCQAVCEGENGRGFVDPNDPAVVAAKQDPLADAAGWNCFCEILQAEGDELLACQTDVSDAPVVNNQGVHGWCYIDATRSPPIGDSDLVANCPPTEQRIIRFVGDGQGVPGATLFITCSGE
ncbi:MAG: hypothetical protein R3B72_01930 [Polyangiaceae bacterium]